MALLFLILSALVIPVGLGLGMLVVSLLECLDRHHKDRRHSR